MKKLRAALMWAWAALLGYFQYDPGQFIALWSSIPQDIKDVMPPYIAKTIGFSLLVGFFAAGRHMDKKKTQKLEQKLEEVTKDESAG